MPRTTDRSGALIAVARNMIRIHKAWQADNNRQNPDDAYYDAVTALIESFEDGEIPEDCRGLATAVWTFKAAADRWENREDTENHYPFDPFWQGIEGIEKALERPADEPGLVPLESITLLNSQGVTHRQIAKMYGLLDPRNGEPMGHLISQELDKPGSVKELQPGVWKDPRLKEVEARRNAASRHAEAIERKAEANPKAPPCPETPRELFDQKVSIEQSAKMLQQPIEDVKAQFDKFATADLAEAKKKQQKGQPVKVA